MSLTSTLPTRLIHFLPANTSEESETNLKELVGGVPLTTLPRTFQDAIKLAASLGIHHLWIDSLCIIQDSKEDWEAEAARMASVYLGAKVTISATAADDSSTGTMPDSMLRYPTYVKPTWTGFEDIPMLQKPFRIIDNTSFSRRVLLRTIFTRGWVYQERILSPKVIHCADDQLWWFSISDAKGYVFNETCKGHEFDVLRMSSLSQSVSPSELYSVRPNSEASPSRRVWWSLVEDYMTRQFTFDSDRLIAIGGVTSVYQRLSGLREDAYLAGLWRHTLLEDLLWTTREGRRSSPPQGYRAPSWSWASMEPIHYHTHKFSLGSVNVQSSSDGLRTFGLVASVEDAKVETTSSRFGSVVDGHLVLHGPLIRAKLSSQMIDVPGAYMYASGISEFFPGGILKYQLSTLSLPEREDAKDKEIADVIADVDLVTKPTLDDTFPIYCSMGESVVYLAVIEHHQFTQDSKLKADRAHALVLERGLHANFNDHGRRMIPYTNMAMLPEAKVYLIANSVLVFVTLLVVALRVVSRVLAGSKLGWDDYFTLLAVPQGIVMLVLQGLWTAAGLGYQLSEIGDNWTFVDSLFLPFETIFGVVSLTTKLSVLFFYLRVFTSRPMRIATRLTFVIVILWGIGNVLQTVLVCHLTDGKWHATNKDICRDHEASILSTGLFNCISNTIIMVVPLYTIWTLRKVMRNLAVTTFLTVLETHLTILCNSLPMLLPLWAFWKHRRFETDEYVSRLGGSTQSGKHDHLVEDLTNGIPLETMYGSNITHFTTTVGTGGMRRGSGNDGDSDVSETESTQRLPRNAQAITIETKWSIKEETTK
ncbi:hypothetical protein K4K49_000179 [Colletotrichum sp. SAR 10_70]|nr:hypothetical protein K4K50_009569 [Colletotrichum sp. SAR 10_71]KAI8204940.1 hypothetical protein K4K49_000179 [Colletotrichum sp. SAR 10_70]KAJ5002791.1 hypothetical protein K4K48_012902 [Colletotrichum sp. SAR 10_66]